MTVAETAQAILVAHQRRDISGCLCGWAELGQSHPGHQVQMLAGAGVLATDPDTSPDCASHRPVQHRDRRSPWCDRCGRDATGQLIGTPRST